VNEDELDRLKSRQTEIYRDYGVWGSTGLAWSAEHGAAEPRLHGTADVIEGDLADAFDHASRHLYDAQQALTDIAKLHLDGVWAGTAHTAAAAVVQALHNDVSNAFDTFLEIAGRLRTYGERLKPAMNDDEASRDALLRAAAAANDLTWGPIPKIAGLGYDGDAMRAAHHAAMAAIDGRVAAHTEGLDNAREFTSAMSDIATRARSGNLLLSLLSPLDDLLIANAGDGQSTILSPAMDQRVDKAITTLSATDLVRWNKLLADAKSPDQQAYLLKALAAGYSIDQITQFNTLIAAHGDDTGWLAAHLSPLEMDSRDPNSAKNFNSFDSSLWTQGQDPTCVAASTVTARAQVDPLYALQLTTGGHPGDPAFENSTAFAERLRDEQKSIYSDGRQWYVNWGLDGMTDSQSQNIADQQIAVHTGTSYTNVDMGDQQARDTTMQSVERAVDNGYPVPLTVAEDSDGRHQMMIIGHDQGRLEIYNPWGYTYWVTENDFVSGHIDGVDSAIPGTPMSVRLPQGSK
jgi:hypothetical protein